VLLVAPRFPEWPSARGFNASRAGGGALAILITAMIALCGMFVCIVAKCAAARLQRPDSKLTGIVVRYGKHAG
jgi:hypothetical protein